MLQLRKVSETSAKIFFFKLDQIYSWGYSNFFVVENNKGIILVVVSCISCFNYHHYDFRNPERIGKNILGVQVTNLHFHLKLIGERQLTVIKGLYSFTPTSSPQITQLELNTNLVFSRTGSLRQDDCNLPKRRTQEAC